MKLKNPHNLGVVLCLLMILAFSSCDPHIPAPAESISIEKANLLQDQFIETRSGVLDSALGFQDARDFQFSLETLKEYIAYVEQEAAKQGKTGLGLRVHFAAYPSEGDYPNPGYSTVFFIPTAQVSDQAGVKGFAPSLPIDVVLDSVNALNYGTGGIPPNDL